MPNSDIDYSNTIIYKITCKNKDIADVYVGHTTNFVQRKHAHKQGCINNKSANHNCKLYEVIRANGGWANWHMEIINFFNCADHYAARKKEQEYFIELKATLNSIEPFPKPKVKINTIDYENPIKPIVPNSSYQFVCEPCHFECRKKSNFDKHILTNKHVINASGTKKNIYVPNKMPEMFACNCGKSYKYYSGLWKHKNKCVIKVKPDIEKEGKNMIDLLISENKDFKNIILELVKNNGDLQKQMLEVCKKININTEI
jgi:hypothetical protein